MPFAAAVSMHPVTAHAAGEVIGQVLEELGPHPDVVFLFVSAGHAGALEDAAGAVRTLLAPTLLLGCSSGTVVATGVEVEEGPAMALWAGVTGPVAPVRIPAPSGLDRAAVKAPEPPPFPPQGIIVLADPRTFPAAPWLDAVAARYPGVPVVGARAAGRAWQGGPALLLDHQVVTTGGVAAFVGPGTGFAALVSQGCRPIGPALEVTRAERDIIYELAGRAALQCLVDIARDQMPSEDIRLVNAGLHVGVALDGAEAPLRPGDFVIRPVMGADRANGAIALGPAAATGAPTALIQAGTTVQFHVRDPAFADRDLRRTLATHAAAAHAAADPGPRQRHGALLFASAQRGRTLFGHPDHDAGAIGDVLGPIPLAGASAVGEIGPARGRNHLHCQAASMAFFSDLMNI